MTYHVITEGGNVFKDGDGNPLTQRINQTDVKTTIAWLEQLLPGLDLQNNTLGTTGLKPTSGDLDIAIDAGQLNKDQLVAALTRWVIGHGQEAKDWIKKSGISVHFKTPINGRPAAGFVQTDFMFVTNLDWAKFMLAGSPPDSEYKGADRNILMNSIAKSMGYKVNQNVGIVDRATNELISNDPDKIAKLLLNPRATKQNLASVETMVQALEKDPKRDAKLADAREHFAREGVPFFEDRSEETEVYFLARLRDRIVNQGYTPLIEQRVLTEAEARIPHLEDLVFDAGTKGAQQALQIILAGAQDTAGTTTVKWDGKPAIIWGRKPTGEFVLTDKSGFGAKGYDGKATSPAMLGDIMRKRSGDREELIAMYQQLWPALEQATPRNLRGYLQGDLLYTQTPPEVAGAYEFQPNTVKYRIPANSALGQSIANSDIGIAVHTQYDDANSAPQAIQNLNARNVQGLLLIPPTVKDIKSVEPNTKLVKEIRSILRAHGNNIDQLFRPDYLRAARITDLPELCKRYINSRIFTDFDNLLQGFGDWLEQNVTPSKYRNIIEYLQSPKGNTDGLSSAFSVFLLLHQLKMDVLQQLDRQQPGQEGWVMATDAGRAKLVNRFAFSAANRLKNNPELA
jgi:hypothetical protein